MAIEVFISDIGKLLLSNPIGRALVIASVRSFFGWAQIAFADGKITRYELCKLLTTFCRIIPQAIGLGAIVPGAEAGALFSDYAISEIRKKRK